MTREKLNSQNNRNFTGFVLVLGALLFLGLGAAIGILITSSDTPCGTGNSSFWDEQKARSFGASEFPKDEWVETYSVAPYHITVARNSDAQLAIVMTEYLIYNCGMTDADIETYFSPDNFTQIILADYENVQPLKQCRAGETRLYEFRAQFGGQDYLLSQWARPDGDKRVLAFFMAFPVTQASALRAHAGKLFPELPACP
jgi:hypothetical protein